MRAAAFRLARGVLTQSNFGVVRFEVDDEGRVTACQDLYTNQPGKHEGVLVNTYRVELERFGDELPKLSFIERRVSAARILASLAARLMIACASLATSPCFRR